MFKGNKVIICFILSILFLSTFGGSLSSVQAASKSTALTEELESDSSNSGYDTYYNSWGSDSFQNTNGKLVTKGIGFSPYYGGTYRMWSSYTIEDYNYTTFEATLSLDKKWKTGSRGKTTFIIYADDKKIYTKTFKNTTPATKVQLPIPKGTAEMTLEVVMEKGSQGNHKVIIENPVLTNSLKSTAAFNGVSLASIGTSSESTSGYDLDYGSWNGSAFEMTDGTLVGRGYGFSPYYGGTSRMWATFPISDYSYTTLETTVSLENKWRIGDLGKSQVIIYADNKVIYTKNFTNKTPLDKIKASIPSGTQELTLEVIVEKGKQGNHKIIFDNPLLTNSYKQTAAYDSVALADIGVAENSNSGYDYDFGSWNSSAFQLTDGTLAGRGYGLHPYYSVSSEYDAWISFFTGDYNYPTLETTISLENKWRSGNRGSSTVYVLADDKIIYKKSFNNTTPLTKLAIPVPKNTDYLTLKTAYTKGSNGQHGVIFTNPILTNRDVTPPNAPKVNSINDSHSSVMGKTEPNAEVSVFNGSKLLGKAKADKNGNFNVKLNAKQKAGTTLTVKAIDASKNVSKATTIKVLDGTAPAAPAVNTLKDSHSDVAGKTEPYAEVSVFNGSKLLGTAKADKSGNFNVKLSAKQKAGTTLTVKAIDASKNVSKATAIKVVKG